MINRRYFLGTAIGSLVAGVGLAQANLGPNLNPDPLAALPAPSVAFLIPDTIAESVTGKTAPVVTEPEVGSHKLIRQPDGTWVNYLLAYYHTDIEYACTYVQVNNSKGEILPPGEMKCTQWHLTRTWFRVGSQLYYGHLERQELTQAVANPL